MIIDRIYISDFGLKRLNCEDHLNFPGRKTPVGEPGARPAVIYFESKILNLTLFGKYSTNAEMITALESFYALVRSKPVHEMRIVWHTPVFFQGSIMDGIQAVVYTTCIKLTFKINVIE